MTTSFLIKIYYDVILNFELKNLELYIEELIWVYSLINFKYYSWINFQNHLNVNMDHLYHFQY
jgi:hypothetical protein